MAERHASLLSSTSIPEETEADHLGQEQDQAGTVKLETERAL